MSQKIKRFKKTAPSVQVNLDSRVIRDLERRFQKGKALELGKDFAGAEKIYREVVWGFERNRFNAATPNAALGYALLNQSKFEEA